MLHLFKSDTITPLLSGLSLWLKIAISLNKQMANGGLVIANHVKTSDVKQRLKITITSKTHSRELMKVNEMPNNPNNNTVQV